MKRWFWGTLSLAVMSVSASEQDIRLLDNRFRIDPTIKQASFVIYREKPSVPVVLVRPDGTKYYAWRHPDHVSWHQETDMDIVSVDNPMPGPWQAIGKVTSENKIKVLTDLSMSVDSFPARLYQGESIKFTARLMQGDEPLNLRDFLDRVDLNVTFTEFLDDPDALPPDQRPQAKSIGHFIDDGTGLDEVPGDGVFTVELPINVPPGKYRARVTSGNGVFFRALEQQILVYPTPLMATFKQSSNEENPHQLLVVAEEGSIEPGSVAVHAEFTDGDGELTVYQGHTQDNQLELRINIPYAGKPGQYKWVSWLYATDLLSSRPLVFALPQQTFAVTDFAALEQAEAERLEREAELMKEAEERRLAKEREDARTMSFIIIGVGNLVVVLLGLITWFFLRWRKAKRLAKEAEQELEAPPPEQDEDKAA